MKKRLLSLAVALLLCTTVTMIPGYCATATAGEPTVIDISNGKTAVIDENGTLWMRGLIGLDDPYIGGVELGNQFGFYYYLDYQKVLDHVVSVSCGEGGTTAAIKEDKSLWVWGNVCDFQRGDGKYLTNYDYRPFKVMDDVAAVSCGGTSMAAIKTDGSLWMWGSNTSQQIGNGGNGDKVLHGDEVYQSVPLKIMDDVVSVCAQNHYTVALKADGTLWCWGVNNRGQIGNGGKGDSLTITEETAQSVPVKVLDNVAAISAEQAFVVALKQDGTVWCWGDNFYGNVGTGEYGNWYTKPQQVFSDAIAICAGSNRSAAIKADGSLWMWGWDGKSGAMLGKSKGPSVNGTKIQPTPLKIMDHVTAVMLGGHNFLQKSDGTWWAWGSNGSKQISNEDVINYATLIPMPGTVAPKSLTVSSPVSPVPTIGGFTDVKLTDYFADAVLWAVEKNITSGTSATTFSPGATCNRAQILTFLWRANGSPEPTAANL